MKPPAPCHERGKPDCPNRAVGCQKTCERYLAFKAEIERRNRGRSGYYDFKDFIIKSTLKTTGKI